MRLSRALLPVLAALLLAAWQSALMHPLVHVKSGGGFVHVGGGNDPQAPGEKKLPNPLCDAMAAVAACVAGTGGALAIAPQGVEQSFIPAAAALFDTRPPAYRSQAPPSFL